MSLATLIQRVLVEIDIELIHPNMYTTHAGPVCVCSVCHREQTLSSEKVLLKASSAQLINNLLTVEPQTKETGPDRIISWTNRRMQSATSRNDCNTGTSPNVWDKGLRHIMICFERGVVWGFV